MFDWFNRTERLKRLRQRIDDVEAEIAVMKKNISNLDVDLEQAKKKKRLNTQTQSEDGAVSLTSEEAAALREQLSALGINFDK